VIAPARTHHAARARFSSHMNSLIYLAIVLVILWVVARVFLAVTGAMLHLLWIVAVICFVIWIFKRVAG
jgi:hypothetical protein